ncbi:replication/maintenance protein RepL [Salmonella enterica subsp. enterica serovar Kiambu]|uniref:DNA-binding protein n=5 Tax=Salmonella enterica TaxID=28901 RepID=A0A3Y9ANI6_SALET|nr:MULTISPECIES: replication/maintenance protein RepL [Salmonella]EAB6690320.1 DNA-binding protein [Salmonella enterica subsp. enterica serovar Kapemba]EBU7170564.1 DNA-binding protein [Salmonella enterica subsp. enterica serovar Enteritidis]ECA1810943.1 DNA-binding protein [Salmonella enterica subsp. enterica serovar Derby]EDX2780785.1 DNA-binding protein [Salmonella enterica subsp. enterica serovar 4,12:nonmotile]KNB30571.1 DNA-binding protein [Salmonella enterica subsp. enterica serovar Typ
MNTNDADLLHLFESLTTEQKIDIAKRLLQNKEIKSTTVISSEEDKSISFSQPYVFAFTSNFRVFSDLDISKNEFRVLTYILEYMEFGNLINLSQSSLCKALNIASGNMSNIFKKLRQKGILVEHHGHLYINSNIFAKGMSHQLDQKRKEQLSNARNLCAEIEQYPESYSAMSKSERRTLSLETETKEIYTDAFVFSKKKKNNAVPNTNNSIHIDKPRKVYKRTKENEEARRNSVGADSHMQKVS